MVTITNIITTIHQTGMGIKNIKSNLEFYYQIMKAFAKLNN
jgi:hypothetical protein